MAEFPPKIERPETEETATEIYLKSQNPKLWEELVGLPEDEQFNRWLALTQRHLRAFREGEAETEEFTQDELALLFLNHLQAASLPRLNADLPQRGFLISAEQPKEKIYRLGNFVNLIKAEAENQSEKEKQFCVLITGIGTSGKATVRSVLTGELSQKCPDKKIISWDRDYQKKFPPTWAGDIELVEDVHGLDLDEDGELARFDGAEGTKNGFDLVVYVLPPAATFKRNLAERGKGWLKAGIIDLTAPEEPAAPKQEMIERTAEKLQGAYDNAGLWLREQLKSLKILKERGVEIAVIDPTEILRKLYGRGETPESSESVFDNFLRELRG